MSAAALRRARADAADEGVAVLARHPEVGESTSTRLVRRARRSRRTRSRPHHRGTVVREARDSRLSRVSGSSSTSRMRTPRGPRRGRVHRGAAGAAPDRAGRTARDRQPNSNVAPWSLARALGAHGAAVAARPGAARSRGRCRARVCAARACVLSAWRKRLEQVRQELRARCPCRCRVTPTICAARRRAADDTSTRPPARRELDRVREQVPDHLPQPIGVADDAPGRRLLSATRARRPSRRRRARLLERRVDHRRRARRAARSSASLPLMMRETSSRSSISSACARALRSITSRPRAQHVRRRRTRPAAQHARPGEDRLERRAQLVRERREELVL